MLFKTILTLSLIITSAIASAEFKETLKNQSLLTITSTFDNPITINKIVLNKGHCAFQNWELTFVKGGLFGALRKKYVSRLPVTLSYGESFILTSLKPGTETPNKTFFTELCPLIRVDIITNRGTVTTTW